jgi:hypothetical protein
MSESSITAYVNNSFTFLMSAHYIYFSAISVVSHQFFICIALCNVGHVSRAFSYQRPMLMKGEIHELCNYMNNEPKQYTWLMVSQWHHFLLASNTEQVRGHISPMPNHIKLKMDAYHLCQITLKQNCGKRNLIKRDLPVFRWFKDRYLRLSVLAKWCVDQIYVARADVNMVMNLQLSSF